VYLLDLKDRRARPFVNCRTPHLISDGQPQARTTDGQ
jgi:hypothetical protein